MQRTLCCVHGWSTVACLALSRKFSGFRSRCTTPLRAARTLGSGPACLRAHQPRTRRAAALHLARSTPSATIDTQRPKGLTGAR